MNSLSKYVNLYLGTYKESFLRSKQKDNYPFLSIDEKVIVYAYTQDKYEDLNEILRSSKGQNVNEFAKHLKQVLKKIPPYADANDLVYRGAFLTERELQVYKDAFEQKSPIVEYHFLSTSKIKSIANYWATNTLFKINPKRGCSVEEIAFHGVNGGQNEYEVLFTCNTKFAVLNITKTPENTYEIMMEEV
jgi:hypothetical protein